MGNRARRLLSFAAGLTLVLTAACREDRKTASLSLDISACFADEGAEPEAGQAICRSALELYAPESMTVCLAVRVGADEESPTDRVCTFTWDTASRAMTSGSCASNKALPEVDTEGERVAMKPFFLEPDVTECPRPEDLHLRAACEAVEGCLFALPPVEQKVVGDDELVLGYGEDLSGPACAVECARREVALPDGGGRMALCWDPGQPAAELCNGADDDCDGEVDEGIVTAGGLGLGEGCGGEGDCAPGVVVCAQDSSGAVCSSVDAGVAELCDGLDNDCDGAVDEDFDVIGGIAGPGAYVGATDVEGELAPVRLGQVCLGRGSCGTGQVRCRYDQAKACCSADRDCTAEGDPGAGSEEVCDGLDNDCDGQADEGLSIVDARGETVPLGEPCSSLGECADGRVVCGTPGGEPAACCSTDVECGGDGTGRELCDGVDNDCDGEIDEDFDVGGGQAFEDIDGTPLALGGPCGGGPSCPELEGRVLCSANAEAACCTARNASGEDPAAPAIECGADDRVWGDERCDRRDNDCDGETDEDFERLGGDCNGRVGICSQADGQVECGPEGGEICSVDPDGSAPAAVEEACDGGFDGEGRYTGTDGDCDGLADPDEPGPDGLLFTYDDDGVLKGLGAPCNLDGFPACGRGIIECAVGDEGRVTRCSSLPGGSDHEALPEVCDDIDNDCDGEVDEGISLDSDPENCGECGRACEYDFGVGGCLEGACFLAGCVPGHLNLDGLDATGCEEECQGDAEVDEPDVDGIDADCDGVDGQVARAVFVAADGDDETEGEIDAPVRSILRALELAAPGARDQILVADGRYDGSVALPSGIGLHGGYHRIGPRWVRDIDAHEAEIRGGHVAVTIASVDQATALMGFTIHSAPGREAVLGDAVGAGGGSSYGLLVRGAPPDLLTISRNRITAGIGGAGRTGSAGGRGQNGAQGGDGSGGVRDEDSGGGAGGGGNGPCGFSGGAGGQGGFDEDGDSGSAGPDGGGSAGGGGEKNNQQAGGAGGPGADGGEVAGGGGGDGVGRLSGEGLWVGSVGSPGGAGLNGKGGGGGGGGGGNGECAICACLPCGWQQDTGGGGGGGGGSACGGAPGDPGGPGGASIGILLHGASPRIEGNVITTGGGGRGGGGGGGGEGGTGGDPGGGGGGPDQAADGGPGGRGGHGGRGGPGGGGGGGVSYPIYGGPGSAPVLVENDLVAGGGGAGGGGPGDPGDRGLSGLELLPP